MRRKSFLALLLLLLFLSPTTTFAQKPKAKSKKKTGAPQANAPDFSIAPAYLESLRKGATIQPTIKFKMGDHSALHNLGSDCEMHIAADPVGPVLGDPNSFILEPPNLCKVGVNGQPANMSADWATTFDGFKDETCDVKGFPRIFTEHAKSAGGASNPLHFYEMHPATQIHCSSQTLTFGPNYVKAFPGMRAITSGSATSCVEKRTLKVRYDTATRMYEFQENGGTCGNFAIAELDNIPTQWIDDVGQGHSAIARASTDGESTNSLKIYTLAGSDIDTWLGALKQNKHQQRKIVLGLFTYDYFAMQKVLFNRTTKKWAQPADWTEIPFPLAFVVYGETDEAPWEE